MDTILITDIENIQKQRHIKRDITKTNPTVMSEMAKIITKTEQHFTDANIEKSTNWMVYKNTWIKNEEGHLKSRFNNYERGDIILSVDLGVLNIGTEIRYPHPCVVIYDNDEDWVIVAPITGATIDQSTQKPIIHPFEVYVAQNRKPPTNPSEFQFSKDSVIQVDQLYRVSKYRIINTRRKKLRVDILNQIDNLILKKYIPKKNELLDKMKELNSSHLETIKSKDAEINELKEKIKELESTISGLGQGNPGLK